MSNDLVNLLDLDYLPGAPFTEAELDAAVAAVRAAAGWHIAPVRTETLLKDVVECDRWLRLPTLKLVSVVEVRNADNAEVVAPASYRVSRNLRQIKRNTAWPKGYEAVEVDMTHGFATCPPELMAVIAEAANLARRDQTVDFEQDGDYSYRLGAAISGTPSGTSQALSRYTLDGSALYGIGVA